MDAAPTPSAALVGRVRRLANLPGILGFASFHWNGYVREAAVERLAELHTGGELPFLLLRVNDWVPQVRLAAAAAVQNRLLPEYAPHFVACLSLVLRLLDARRNDQSGRVREIIQLILEHEPEATVAALARSPDRLVRRRFVAAAMAQPGRHMPALLEHTIASEDSILRLWGARKLAQDADDATFERSSVALAADPFMPVRREILRSQAIRRPTQARELWRGALRDSHRSMRELARFELTRLGDAAPADVYRQALGDDETDAIALRGLGECGTKADVDRIRPYLASSRPKLRKAAVGSLAVLAGDEVADELLSFVQDECPGVAKEASLALRQHFGAHLAESCLAIATSDPRPHVSRLVHRLFVALGKWDRLEFLLRLANSPVLQERERLLDSIAGTIAPRRQGTFTSPSAGQRERIAAELKREDSFVPRPLRDDVRRELDRWP